MTAVHRASAVAIGARALIIEGAPGSGKSSLALALIDRGATLIGDDGLMLEVQAGSLMVMPHPNTRGLIEVRNLGVLPTPVCEAAEAALVLAFDEDAPRFIDRAGSTTLLDIAVPRVALRPDSPNLAIKAELALLHYGRKAD